MNERIKELAEQAFLKANDGSINNVRIPKKFIELFAELICADEREACAKVCDNLERTNWEMQYRYLKHGGRLVIVGLKDCAAAIRARGNE